LSRHLGERLKVARELQGRRQDQVAADARLLGLTWTRATVAAIETGKRDVTAGELLLLPHLLRYESELQALFPDQEWIRLGPDVALDGNAIRRTLAGNAKSIRPHQIDSPGSRSFARFVEQLEDPGVLEQVRRHTAVMEAIWPHSEGGELGELVKADRDAESEVERRAAERLGINPRHLALAARRCWGRSLTEERDARTPEGVRSTGHITRALLAELRPLLASAGLIEGED
jgi:transcriptional regulator with XRE-family HTH domain